MGVRGEEKEEVNEGVILWLDLLLSPSSRLSRRARRPALPAATRLVPEWMPSF